MKKLKEKSCRYLNIQKEIKYHLKGNEQSNRTQNRKKSCQNLDKMKGNEVHLRGNGYSNETLHS